MYNQIVEEVQAEFSGAMVASRKDIRGFHGYKSGLVL